MATNEELVSTQFMMKALDAVNITDLMRVLGVVYEKNQYKALDKYYENFEEALSAAFSQPKFSQLRSGAIDKKVWDQQEFERNIAERNFSVIPENVLMEYASVNVAITTSHVFYTKQIKEELSVITADCVYGMNAFRDVFASVRNLVGGRVGSIEKLLTDGKVEVSRALKLRALLAGGNAIIAVSFDVQVIGDASGSAMIAIHGFGTAVRT